MLLRKEIVELVEKYRADKEGLGAVINPLLDKRMSSQELLEICQIGKFVWQLDEPVKILEKSEKPDFILDKGGKRIGLEHTLLQWDDGKKYHKVNSCIEKARKIYAKEHPDQNLLASIRIDPAFAELSLVGRNQYPQLLADLVHATATGCNVELPEYVEDIRLMKHSKISFYYKERNPQAPYLPQEILSDRVLIKENKLSKYKQEMPLDEYWLVLMVGSLSSISYELNPSVNYSLESEYDRIYLMEDFNAKIHRIR